MQYLYSSVFSTLDFTHLRLNNWAHSLLSKYTLPNFCKWHHHSPARSSQKSKHFAWFLLFLTISASNPSADPDQLMLRTLTSTASTLVEATVIFHPDCSKDLLTAFLTSIPIPFQLILKRQSKQCIKNINSNMALSFLEPPLTSCCISNEIQELTSSAPLFL